MRVPTKMNRANIQRKLQKGMALAKREDEAQQVITKAVNTVLDKPVPVCTLGEYEDFADYGNFIDQLKGGNMLPDELFGWSTKTILAALLALLIFKLKSMRKK